MAHGLFDQQAGSVLALVAGQGGWWFDSQTGLLMYKDASGLAYGRSINASLANQGPGFAVDTYLTGSPLKIPTTGFKAGTKFRWLVSVTKTAAGIAQPLWTLRLGTNQTTADTQVAQLTNFAQTAAADDGTFELIVAVRSIGAAGVVQFESSLKHNAAATGLTSNDGDQSRTTSAGFDNTSTTIAGKFLGLSVNGGASASWTITLVQAEADW